MDENYNIGRSIREVREARDLTQQQMSDYTGLTINYISRLENGHRGVSIKALNDIGEFLDFPPAFLIALNHPDVEGEFRETVSDIRGRVRKYFESIE